MPVYSPGSSPQTFPAGGRGLCWTPTPEMTWEDASLVTWALRCLCASSSACVLKREPESTRPASAGRGPRLERAVPPCLPRAEHPPDAPRTAAAEAANSLHLWLKDSHRHGPGGQGPGGAHLVSPRTLLADGRRQLSPLGRVIIFFRLPSG